MCSKIVASYDKICSNGLLFETVSFIRDKQLKAYKCRYDCSPMSTFDAITHTWSNFNGNVAEWKWAWLNNYIHLKSNGCYNISILMLVNRYQSVTQVCIENISVIIKENTLHLTRISKCHTFRGNCCNPQACKKCVVELNNMFLVSNYARLIYI